MLRIIMMMGMMFASTYAAVTASDGTYTDKVVVRSDATLQIGYYLEIARADSEGGDKSVLGTTTTAPYDDTTADPGIIYYYSARTCKGTGMSKKCFTYSEEDSGFRRLLAPTGVSATDGTDADKVIITFDTVPGADKYTISRRELGSSMVENIATLITENTFDDTSAKIEGNAYSYKVTAYSSSSHTYSYKSDADYGYRTILKPNTLSVDNGSATTATRLYNYTLYEGSDEFRYDIYKSTSYTGLKLHLVYTDAGQYYDMGATPGTEYYYFVRTCNGVGCGDFAPYVRGHKAISAPSDINASDGTSTDSIIVSNYSVTGATRYYICSDTSSDFTDPDCRTTEQKEYPYRNLTPGVQYYFKVKAHGPSTGDSSEWTDYSDPDTGFIKLSAPINLTASDNTYTNMVNITYSYVTGATGYKIFKSTSSTIDGTEIYKGTATSFNDTDATPGITYYYYVQAYFEVDGIVYNGEKSIIVEGVRKILSPPASITASDGTYTDKVEISCSAVTGASEYTIFKATSSTSLGSDIYTGSATSFNDTIATPGITYYYSVQACVDGVCSANNDPDTGYRETLDSDGDGIYDHEDMYPNDGPLGDYDGDGELNNVDTDDCDGPAVSDQRACYEQGTLNRITGKRVLDTQPYPEDPCGQDYDPCIQGTQEAVIDPQADYDPGAYDDRPDCDPITQYLEQGTNTCQNK